MRRTSGLLLLLAVGSACGASPPPTAPSSAPADTAAPESPPSVTRDPVEASRIIDHCSADSVRPGNAVLICDRFTLWIAQPLGEASAVALERIRRTHMDAGRPVSTRATTLRVAGEDFPATEYELPDGRRVAFGVVRMAAGTDLVATCVATPSARERCLTALGEVARDGFPAYARAAAGPPKIGQLELSIPPGCSIATNNRIRCPTSELHWGEANADSEQTIADNMERGLQRLGSVTRSHMRCTLLSVATQCHVYRVSRSSGPMTVVAAVAATPSGMFFTQCNAFDTRLGLAPSPCSQIIDVPTPAD